MIGSIRKAWRPIRSAQPASSSDAGHEQGLTRSAFLGLAAMGALSAGAGLAASKAFAADKSKTAPVTDLDGFYDVWQDAFNTGDIDRLVGLYVPDVTYVNPDGKAITGEAAVRNDFEELLALKPQVVLGNRKHLVWHDIALTTNHWKLHFADDDGTLTELTGGGIEVVRKEADGGWRFIIDDASRSAV
jgi:uncharacterized protein (TIGR02246 family)